MPDDLVQQSAQDPLFGGSEKVVRTTAYLAPLTVGESMLLHALSRSYGVSGGGRGRRGAGACRLVAVYATGGRNRRWESAVGGSGM